MYNEYIEEEYSSFSFLLMTINEKYVQILLPTLSPCRKKKFKGGFGYSFPCPFCGATNATLKPLEGSFQWVFACEAGMKRGPASCRCGIPMNLNAFIGNWNPPLQRKYEKEQGEWRRSL